MGKIESFKGVEKFSGKLKKKIEKKQFNLVFTDDVKIKNAIDKEKKVMFIEEIKVNLNEYSEIEAVRKNREENKKKVKEEKYFKNYNTLDFAKESDITLVTGVQQLSDKIIMDELKTFVLENLNKKINIFLQEKEIKGIFLEDLYNFVLQEKIKLKIFLLK